MSLLNHIAGSELTLGESLVGDSLMREVADATDGYVALLDENREVVFANQKLLHEFGGDLRKALGHRFGELVGCRNANRAPDGCGTTPECLECGANKAIRSAGMTVYSHEECRILRADGEPIDLAVTVGALAGGPEPLTLVTAVDISDRKRREALERIFFHDIMNTATGVQGLSAMIRSVPEDEREEILDLIETSSQQLVDEVAAQRQLLEAEKSELVAEPQPVRSSRVLHDLVGMYGSHEVCAGKELMIDHDDDVELMIDPVLLSRVLGNLTKNALEATDIGQLVSVGCTGTPSRVRFTVHNPAVMPISVQRQVFQRSFTTKGRGRGLGTYSSRLITKRYLSGDIAFSSRDGEGTTFTVSFPRSA